MDESSKPIAPWTASRSAKEKNVVQRAVTALLNQLAPLRFGEHDLLLLISYEWIS